MSHIDEIRCDGCDKVIDRKLKNDHSFLDRVHSEYRLQLWNTKGYAYVRKRGSKEKDEYDWDLCPGCYGIVKGTLDRLKKELKGAKK